MHLTLQLMALLLKLYFKTRSSTKIKPVLNFLVDHSVHRRPMVGHGGRAQLAGLAWNLSADPRT